MKDKKNYSFIKKILKKCLAFLKIIVYNKSCDADVAELADALDLGSSVLRRGGSTPFICTNFFVNFAEVTQW